MTGLIKVTAIIICLSARHSLHKFQSCGNYESQLKCAALDLRTRTPKCIHPNFFCFRSLHTANLIISVYGFGDFCGCCQRSLSQIPPCKSIVTCAADQLRWASERELCQTKWAISLQVPWNLLAYTYLKAQPDVSKIRILSCGCLDNAR